MLKLQLLIKQNYIDELELDNENLGDILLADDFA